MHDGLKHSKLPVKACTIGCGIDLKGGKTPLINVNVATLLLCFRINLAATISLSVTKCKLYFQG